MSQKLDSKQIELSRYMSQLSEEAYCAGWMSGLEFALWNAVQTGPCEYGRLQLTEEHLAKLRDLSRACGGWIAFDMEILDEKWIPFAEWERMYEEHQKTPQRSNLTIISPDRLRRILNSD